MLIGVVLAIAGVITGTVVIVGSTFRFMGMNFMSIAGNDYTFNPSTVPSGDWVGLVGGILAGLVLVWAMLLASAVFVRRSYNEISADLKIPMFRTAGLLYLVGAATTIILVGFLLLLVAQILLAVAFFSMQESAPAEAPQPAPVAPGL